MAVEGGQQARETGICDSRGKLRVPRRSPPSGDRLGARKQSSAQEVTNHLAFFKMPR
jgi:hypothetical protein